MNEQDKPKQEFMANASAKDTSKKWGYVTLQGMIYRDDGEPMTEADWDTVMVKVVSIINSHKLLFKGQSKVMGLVSQPENEPKLILPPNTK